MGKVRLRYKLCRWGCEINNTVRGKAGNFAPFNLPGSSDPYPTPPSAQSFLSSLLCLCLSFSKIAACLGSVLDHTPLRPPP